MLNPNRPIDTSKAIIRPQSEALNQILGHALPVLDHGFIRVVDYMGDDAAVVQAARVSYGQGTKAVQEDEGLINYLMRNWHTTPFEMAEIKLHVRLPLSTARQWIRSRTANVNEYSTRYSVVPDLVYIPDLDRIGMQSKSNKQGTGQAFHPDEAEQIRENLIKAAQASLDFYHALVDKPEEGGIGMARELARDNLPLNIYTEWYWKTDVHNLFNFLRNRTHPHAQFEIRQYAEVVESIIAQWMPLSFKAYYTYQKTALSFSTKELAFFNAFLNNPESRALYEAIRGLDVEVLGKQGVSKGEWREFLDKLNTIDQLNPPLIIPEATDLITDLAGNVVTDVGPTSVE